MKSMVPFTLILLVNFSGMVTKPARADDFVLVQSRLAELLEDAKFASTEADTAVRDAAESRIKLRTAKAKIAALAKLLAVADDADKDPIEGKIAALEAEIEDLSLEAEAAKSVYAEALVAAREVKVNVASTRLMLANKKKVTENRAVIRKNAAAIGDIVAECEALRCKKPTVHTTTTINRTYVVPVSTSSCKKLVAVRYKDPCTGFYYYRYK